ncbi:electron transfer flavoprotein subunit beta/FixA family protein [bacterium]|nr:electron transfer flavoprotein subunit beta/FixA family protein [bacterium]
MNIVVFIKQVPDTTDIKWTENNTIDRNGLESILNPKDGVALETALRLKDRYGAKVTAVTMGPFQAEAVLRLALAMGADDAFLLTDRKFSGADTVATARVLAQLIKDKLGDTDLILCGQVAIDGETGQVGPSVAAQLNIPQLTYVDEILMFEDNKLTVKKETEQYIETISAELPVLICVNSELEPRLPKIDGYIKAQQYCCNTVNMEGLTIEQDKVGLKGSPTYVSKVFKPENKHQGETENFSADSAAAAWHLKEKIIDYMGLRK